MSPEDIETARRIDQAVVRLAEVLPYLDDPFLTKPSCARLLDLKSDKPIKKAIASGELKAFKIGKKILVKKSHLISWVASHELTRIRREEKNGLVNLVDRAVAIAKGKEIG